jgi:hypothetical protein
MSTSPTDPLGHAVADFNAAVVAGTDLAKNVTEKAWSTSPDIPTALKVLNLNSSVTTALANALDAAQKYTLQINHATDTLKSAIADVEKVLAAAPSAASA